MDGRKEQGDFQDSLQFKTDYSFLNSGRERPFGRKRGPSNISLCARRFSQGTVLVQHCQPEEKSTIKRDSPQFQDASENTSMSGPTRPAGTRSCSLPLSISILCHAGKSVAGTRPEEANELSATNGRQLVSRVFARMD